MVLNTSLLSVEWDVRAMWHTLSGTAQIYFFALIGCVVWITARRAKVLRLLRQSRWDAEKICAIKRAKSRSQMRANQQLLLLMILIFAAVLANEIFLCLRTAQLSRFFLSEYHVEEALQVPMAFAFLSACAFIYSHFICWIVEAFCAEGIRKQ